eukprot:6470904-Amphidinium_carterae.1
MLPCANAAAGPDCIEQTLDCQDSVSHLQRYCCNAMPTMNGIDKQTNNLTTKALLVGAGSSPAMRASPRSHCAPACHKWAECPATTARPRNPHTSTWRGLCTHYAGRWKREKANLNLISRNPSLLGMARSSKARCAASQYR